MDNRQWKRIKESELKERMGMLPNRVVLEHDEADHSYRTFVETIREGQEPGFHYGRFFYWQEEALEDFNKRLRRL